MPIITTSGGTDVGDPYCNVIWAQPYFDAEGRALNSDGEFFVDYNGNGILDTDTYDFDVDGDGTLDTNDDGVVDASDAEVGVNEVIQDYSNGTFSGFNDTHALAAPGSTPTSYTPGVPGRTGRDEEFGGYRYGITTTFTWETDNNKLIFGGWYEYDRHITERPNYNLQNGGSVVGWFEYDQFNFLNYSRYLEQEVYQGWIQDTYTTLDGALDIVAGIKAIKLDRDADGFLTISEWINNTPTARSTSYEDTFLPQFGLVYRINDNLEVFFNYSENLAVPDAGTITTAGDTFNPDILNPEYSENFDFGIRADYGDVAFNLQGFYLEYTDRILASAVPIDSANAGAAGNSVFQNVGGVDSWGFEGSIDYTTPIEGLELSGSFAIQETTFQEDFFLGYEDSPATRPGLRTGEFVDGLGFEVFEDIEGNDLGNTPFLTLNGDVKYKIDAWTFSLSGKFYDEVYVNTLNTQPLDSYTKFDAGIFYSGKEGTALEGWSASLNVVNLFDEDIALARSYTDSTGQVLWDRGRQFTFTVTADF